MRNAFVYTHKHTSLSFDSVKHTKVESSLVSPADMTKRAVSTVIHEEDFSDKTEEDHRNIFTIGHFSDKLCHNT